MSIYKESKSFITGLEACYEKRFQENFFGGRAWRAFP